MKICTAVILYNPNIDDLKKSLPVYCDETDLVILWQNSLINDEFQLYCKKNYNNILVTGTGENLGIATALNHCVKLAELNDFDYILTMDQDSYFDKGMITKYMSKIIKNNSMSVGIFGINPLQNNKTLYKKNLEVLKVSDTITSGSVFKISNFHKTGYFRDDLFIDAVDYEYCYRLKKRFNLETIVFSDIILNHTVGYAEKTKFGFSVSNYSAFRSYFIVRNQFKIWKMYPELFSKKYKIILLKDHFFIRIIKVILAEKKKTKKIKAILIGFYHFLINKSGFYEVK